MLCLKVAISTRTHAHTEKERGEKEREREREEKISIYGRKYIKAQKPPKLKPHISTNSFTLREYYQKIQARQLYLLQRGKTPSSQVKFKLDILSMTLYYIPF